MMTKTKYIVLISILSFLLLLGFFYLPKKWQELQKEKRVKEKRLQEEKVMKYMDHLQDGFATWNHPKEVFLSAIQTNFLGTNVELVSNHIIPKYHFWRVAQANAIHVDCVIACNPFLTSLHAQTGQVIYTPKGENGAFHYVQTNEDLHILSALYNVEMQEILVKNTLSSNQPIPPGSVLFIPGARPKVLTDAMRQSFMKRKIFRIPTDGWVRGRGFGMKMHPILKKVKFHAGIDMKAKEGTLVFATKAGEVVFSGWSGGYGNKIVLKHQNGFKSVYAHLSKRLVKLGQKVSTRKVIGKVGNTGNSTGAHLHFEIHQNGRPIDPLEYLW